MQIFTILTGMALSKYSSKLENIVMIMMMVTSCELRFHPDKTGTVVVRIPGLSISFKRAMNSMRSYTHIYMYIAIFEA